MLCEFLRISPRIGVLPIIHGSGDFAVEVRRVMLSAQIDCLAVPLPASFQSDVERAIDFLPVVTAVVQPEPPRFDTEWTGQASEETESAPAASYVPIDPCQGVIAALRIALGEQIPRAFIDRKRPASSPWGPFFPILTPSNAFLPRDSQRPFFRPCRRPSDRSKRRVVGQWRPGCDR